MSWKNNKLIINQSEFSSNSKVEDMPCPLSQVLPWFTNTWSIICKSYSKSLNLYLIGPQVQTSYWFFLVKFNLHQGYNDEENGIEKPMEREWGSIIIGYKHILLFQNHHKLMKTF